MTIRSTAMGLSLVGVLLGTNDVSASEPTKQQCIDANSSAQELRSAGSLRAAREKLVLCVSAKCPGPVREDCAERLDEVNKAIPSLVFVAKDSTGRDLGAVRITMDGEPLAEKLDGTAIAIDPGSHRFGFEAEGLTRVEKTLIVREGDKGRRERVVFVRTATASAAAATPSGPSSDGSTQRMAGFVLGGAGALGVVIGGIVGIVAKSTYDHALNSECGPSVGLSDANKCFAKGGQDVQSAHDLATVSTVGFVGGALLLGGGAYLYFTAPKSVDVSVGPAVGLGSAGLSVHGGW